MQKTLLPDPICLLLFILLWIPFNPAVSQKVFSSGDRIRIQQQISEKEIHTHRSWGFGKKKFLLNFTLAVPLFIYQNVISEQISATCLYIPSCSEYSKLLFSQQNAFKATLGTMDRLMRCDRISATDFRPEDLDPFDGKAHEDSNYYKF